MGLDLAKVPSPVLLAFPDPGNAHSGMAPSHLLPALSHVSTLYTGQAQVAQPYLFPEPMAAWGSWYMSIHWPICTFATLTDWHKRFAAAQGMLRSVPSQSFKTSKSVMFYVTPSMWLEKYLGNTHLT